MENLVHEEVRHGLNIKIYRDEDARTPDEDGDESLFLVGYHRDFSVDGPRVYHKFDGMGSAGEKTGKGVSLVDRHEAVALVRGKAATDAAGESWPADLAKRFHVFALEAYIHSGVRLALVADAAPFVDRRWDVSLLGAVFVSRAEWPKRSGAERAARGLVDGWNDVMAGNVYGYRIESASPDLTDENRYEDSCWGFIGDYEKGALKEARALVDHMTKNGQTDAAGQLLFPWAPERVAAEIQDAGSKADGCRVTRINA